MKQKKSFPFVQTAKKHGYLYYQIIIFPNNTPENTMFIAKDINELYKFQSVVLSVNDVREKLSDMFLEFSLKYDIFAII